MAKGWCLRASTCCKYRPRLTVRRRPRRSRCWDWNDQSLRRPLGALTLGRGRPRPRPRNALLLRLGLWLRLRLHVRVRSTTVGRRRDPVPARRSTTIGRHRSGAVPIRRGTTDPGRINPGCQELPHHLHAHTLVLGQLPQSLLAEPGESALHLSVAPRTATDIPTRERERMGESE